MQVQVGRGEYMRTWTGRKFYPLDPRPEEVSLTDIAHHLSMLCRFNGGLNRFYSVAEHSVIVARVVAQTNPRYALWALLHDASEAYLGDMIRPLKHSSAGVGYREVESNVMRSAILPYFALPKEEPPIVKLIDARLCITEALHLRTNRAADVMQVREGFEPLSAKQCGWSWWRRPGWSPRRAEREFLAAFDHYDRLSLAEAA